MNIFGNIYMNTFQKTFLLFIFACILTRSIFVIIALKIPKKYLPYFGYLGIVIGLGFIYTFIINKKRGSIFGQIAWWRNLRPIHALLYLIFGYLAINKNNYAYIPLLIDVLFGLFSFIIYHFKMGSFKKLF